MSLGFRSSSRYGHQFPIARRPRGQALLVSDIARDYNMRAEYLYHDIAKQNCELTHSLTLLTFGYSASGTLELPTWAAN
jgi:hypothetical protein